MATIVARLHFDLITKPAYLLPNNIDKINPRKIFYEEVKF